MLAADLFVTFEQSIQKYIYRRISDPDITKDLTSHTFCKATEAIAAGKGPRTSVSGWLYRIAHNAIIDYYRQRDRHRSISFENCFHHPVSDHDPARNVERIELQTKLLRAMHLLTPGQQQVIRMRFLEGYSFAEIAATMEITEGAVKALQHRALTTLRGLIGDIV